MFGLETLIKKLLMHAFGTKKHYLADLGVFLSEVQTGKVGTWVTLNYWRDFT
jgi:hypothetical protein